MLHYSTRLEVPFHCCCVICHRKDQIRRSRPSQNTQNGGTTGWTRQDLVIQIFNTSVTVPLSDHSPDTSSTLCAQKSRLPPDLHNITGGSLCLDYQQKSAWFDSRAGTLGAQLQGGVEGFVPTAASELADMLENMCDQGQLDKALTVLFRMDQQGIVPSLNVYRSLLKTSMKRKALLQAKQIHAHLVQHGLESTTSLGEYVVSTLVKCGGLEDALKVFHRLPCRTVFAWTAVISGFTAAGQGQEALKMYHCMREKGLQPDKYTIVSVLQACGSIPDLKEGREVHREALKYGCQSELFVGTALVDMYAKCRSIADAQKVFDGLSQRDVVSWNAMLGAYASQGQAEKVLQLYQQMQREGVSPNCRTFVSALQACGMLAEKERDVVVDGQPTKLKALERGKAIHTDARRKGHASDIFVANTLISMYGKCRSIPDAQSVFDGIAKRDVVSWNALLVAHTQQGHPEEALQVYEQILLDGVSPDVRTFLSALQACSALAEKEEAVMDEQGTKWKALARGKKIHDDAWEKGFASHVFIGNTLVSMYGKCGSILDAQHVFNTLSQRTVVSWTAMLMAYTQHGQAEKAMELYEQMLEECVSPDVRVFVSSLQACGMLATSESEVVDKGLTDLASIAKGKVMHAKAWNLGHRSDVFIGSALVSMYAKCGSITDAQIVFDQLSERDVAAWNAMVAAYIEQGQADMAFQLYTRMLEEGVSPDFWTFVRMLQACGVLAEEDEDIFVDGVLLKPMWLQKGKAMHAGVQYIGCNLDVFVENTLVSMYGKCGSTLDAQHVFDGLTHLNVVTWNSLLTAYIQQDKADLALEKYEQMLEDGMGANDRTFVSMLQACGMLAELEDGVVVGELLVKAKSFNMGRAIHVDACRMGFTSDVFIGSTLVSMYGKCGSVADAEQVFDGLSERDVVRWNAMLSAHAEQGSAEKSLQLYRQMQEEGVRPNEITLMCILQACSHTGSLDVCVEIHDAIISNGINLTTLLASALIHAYGRCASMVDAQNVFDAMAQHDVVSWTALIAGYSREGAWETSLQCYEAMQQAGVKPNGVTFLSLLSACTHGGLVDKGVEYFESMSKDHSLVPEVEHYASMVDLLGRAGYFTRVQGLLSTMPMQPDLAIWLCLLGACRTHHKVELGEEAFEQAVRLQPNHAAAYLLMANVYADAGRLDLAHEVHARREQAGALKKPGQSWIRHEQDLHTFVVQDREHAQVERLYHLLGDLNTELEKAQVLHPERESNHAFVTPWTCGK